MKFFKDERLVATAVEVRRRYVSRLTLHDRAAIDLLSRCDLPSLGDRVFLERIDAAAKSDGGTLDEIDRTFLWMMVLTHDDQVSALHDTRVMLPNEYVGKGMRAGPYIVNYARALMSVGDVRKRVAAMRRVML